MVQDIMNNYYYNRKVFQNHIRQSSAQLFDVRNSEG